MDKQFQELVLEELKNIRSELQFIKSELDIIKQGTNKMENHINFVDAVYDRVKTPFHYICDTVSKVKKIGDQ